VSRTKVYEFVGGPLDGEVREVESWVGVISLVELQHDLTQEQKEAINLRETTYLLRYDQKTERAQMIWQGEK
jgi:hypothetical protein